MKDALTLDGRFPFRDRWVNKTKLDFTHNLVERMLNGDRQAKGLFEGLMTTSELGLNMAHLTNVLTIPSVEKDKRVSDRIAGVRKVSDFRDNYLYSLQLNWKGGAVGDEQETVPVDFAPIVPEGSAYPEASFAGELISNSRARKRGIRTGITMEAIVNDSLGVVTQFPNALRELGKNTIDRDVVTTLINGVGANQQIVGATSIEGITVGANPAISRASLDVAMTQLSKQMEASYRDTFRGNLILLVGLGKKRGAESVIRDFRLDTIKETISGKDYAYSVSLTDTLSSITVEESAHVTGNKWYLFPAPGTTTRPVLDRLQLIGHEDLEIRMNNATGTLIGSRNPIHPFEGSFDTDEADWRLRVVTGGALWSPNSVVWSNIS